MGLAIIAGSSIITMGGGGIRPMQERWESALSRYDEEKPRMQQEMEGAWERIEDRVEEVKGEAKAELQSSGSKSGAKPAAWARAARRSRDGPIV
ncbi:MAG: hypothetical protein Q8K58_11740 [Acidimicrobiales bacterium]|nr:hypothetical protein [Acidimicrobiales bacterium]